MHNQHDDTIQQKERRIVDRPRLMAQLDAAPSRTRMLVAPAGYGKTTLLHQWLSDRPARWYSAGLAATDVAALARGLAEVYSEEGADHVRYVGEVLTVLKNPARAPDEVARALLEVLPASGVERLVIDNYERIALSQSAERVVELLHESGRFELIISSRTRPSWASARRFMYGELFSIGADELVLTPNEVSDVLVGVSAPDAMLNQASGWPAVIGLIASAGVLDTAGTTVPPTLYEFFAEEIFNRTSPEVQAMLVDAALLPSLMTSQRVFESSMSDETFSETSQTGLAQHAGDRITIHPLARAFFVEKLRHEQDGRRRVQKALEQAINASAWDDAFWLVRTFHLVDAVDAVVSASFQDLLEAGRISTLEAMAHSTSTDFNLSVPALELVEAEVAFRDGLLQMARALARAAADRLEPSHPLRSPALALAGSAAQLLHDLDDAYDLNRKALDSASNRHDLNAALWGQCLALIFLERPEMRSVADTIAQTAETPEEQVRAAIAGLQIALRESLRDADRHGSASALLHHVRDPRVRTSFGNSWAYTLILQGRYEEAATVASVGLEDVGRFQLSFARPHLEWALAAAALGTRQFSQADRLLRGVEAEAEDHADRHHELNARSLRARLLLAMRKPADAVKVVSADWDSYPSRIMYGEYLGTRALALAVVGETDRALEEAAAAVEISSGVESRLFAQLAQAIAARGSPLQDEAALSAFDLAANLEVWDPLVMAARAMPEFLKSLVTEPKTHRLIARALHRANDAKLARAVGLSVEIRYGRRGALSQRELEVYDLLAQGLTNRQIASALYITESTAKIHLRNIYEKLNVRSRAEAVARHAEG
jgi:ATP/maltotriose-dependent transcriptional regulator MalT